jgi:hypothetical protein
LLHRHFIVIGADMNLAVAAALQATFGRASMGSPAWAGNPSMHQETSSGVSRQAR